jgi:hypothetical protein
MASCGDGERSIRSRVWSNIGWNHSNRGIGLFGGFGEMADLPSVRRRITEWPLRRTLLDDHF